MLVAACTKPVNPSDTTFRLQVGTVEPETKTAMAARNAAGKYPILWSAGDVISINGYSSRALAFSAAGSASASFEFDAKPAAASVYHVAYPSAPTGKVHFLSEQYYVENSFCPGAVPMAGQTSNLEGGVLLHSCAAIVHFTLKGSVTLSDMCISCPGGEKISGDFTIDDDLLEPSSSAGTQIDYSFGDGLALTPEGKAITFAVPLGSYSKGIRALVSAADGTSMAISVFTSGATLGNAVVCKYPDLAYQAGKEVVFTTADAFSSEELDLEGVAGNSDMYSREASAAVSIKAGTYNIWSPSARKSVMDDDETVSAQRSWANSYTAVADMIKWLDCDVIGIQEVTKMVYQTTLTSGNADYDGNVHTLNPLLTDYKWVVFNASNTTYDNLSNNTTANGLGNTDAILYKNSVLTLVSKGRYWLNGTRKKAPQDATWDQIGTNRPATWAKFTHKASGKQFVFIVCHLDLPNAGNTDDSAYPQRRNATELIEWFAPLVTEGLPSIIVGDMNMEKGDVAGNYNILVSGRWKDVFDTMLSDGSLAYTDQRLKGTMNANKNEEGGFSSWRPDHVLFHGFTPSYYKVGRETFATADGTQHWPSDHFPIKVILNF